MLARLVERRGTCGVESAGDSLRRRLEPARGRALIETAKVRLPLLRRGDDFRPCTLTSTIMLRLLPIPRVRSTWRGPVMSSACDKEEEDCWKDLLLLAPCEPACVS